jgi:Helicase conserved C-terminal domain
MAQYHPDNPCIVQSDHTILVEVHSSRYPEARDALARFAELVKSPEHVHTYRITPLSIWNACAAGMVPQQIIDTLHAFAKYDVPLLVTRDIAEVAALACTSPRCPSPSTRHARRAKRWQGRGVAPGSAGSLGHALHPLAMRSPGGAALGVRADPRRGHQAAGGHGGTHAVGGKDSREKWLCISYTPGQ